MAEEKKFLRKALLAGAALSFPLGVLILGAPDEWFAAFQAKSKSHRQQMAGMVEESLALETQAVKQMDLDIIKARGEVLKLREMRDQKLTQLQSLQGQLMKLIEELQTSDLADADNYRGSYNASTLGDQRKSR